MNTVKKQEQYTRTKRNQAPFDSFQRALEVRLGRKLKIRINDNHSTMLSVRWEPDLTRVSLHRIFLSAPTDVVEALAYYLKRKDRQLAPSVKAYIAQCRQNLDYSHAIDPSALEQEGYFHDLQELYDEVNQEYFGGKIKLLITWFGEPVCRNKSRVSFGLYHDTLRLIKINRILDKRTVPRFFISYVIFHEMLHHICPPYVDEDGTNRIHNEEFKRREMQFGEYHQALKWIRDNREKIFAGV